MRATPLRQRLEAAGWRGTTDAVWERIGSFRGGVAFLAPPLDTIPSPFGNAIYSLVESLAAHIRPAPFVLARWPAEGSPRSCEISDRILYDTAPLRPSPLELLLPHRVKKVLWGTSAPHLLGYARRAARAARGLGIRTLVIEDTPIFAPSIRRHSSKSVRLLLHQHNNAAAAMPLRQRYRLGASLDGIVFVAAAARRTAEASNGQVVLPSWVVYNGIDRGHFSPERWSDERARRRRALAVAAGDAVIAFVGRIIPGKGIAETADAFNAMARADARLLIVGDLDRSLYADARYTMRIREAAAKSNGRITLAGAVPQSHLPGWYCAADVVVVPSVASEGLPKTITEALSMGKPCLVTNRGGARELIHDGVNGWIIPDPVTPASIQDGMVRAIAEFRRLSPAASPTDISLEGMVRRFEQILADDNRGRTFS